MARLEASKKEQTAHCQGPGSLNKLDDPSSPGNAESCRMMPVVTGKKTDQPDRAGNPVTGMGDNLTDSRVRQARCASTKQPLFAIRNAVSQ